MTRSFDRTFILTPAPAGSNASQFGSPVIILNDALNIRSWRSKDRGWANAEPQPSTPMIPTATPTTTMTTAPPTAMPSSSSSSSTIPPASTTTPQLETPGVLLLKMQHSLVKILFFLYILNDLPKNIT